MYLLLAIVLLFVPLFIPVKSGSHGAPPAFLSKDYTNILRCLAITMVVAQHTGGFVLGSRVLTPLGGGGYLYSW